MKFSDRLYYRYLNFFFVGREATRLSGVYCELLKGEKNLLVDCGAFYDWPDVEQFCLSAGISLADVTAIIHTHNHADHAGADAEIMKRYPNIQIWAHSAGKAWLEDKSIQLRERPISYFDFLMSGSVPVARTFEDGEILTETGYPVQVIHTPGHSPDSVSFFLPEDSVLLMGDALPNFEYLPFYDDLDATLASIDKCEALKPRYVLSAFNGMFDMQETDVFAKSRERIAIVDKAVKDAMAAGGDKEKCAYAVIEALGLKAQPIGLFYTTIEQHMKKH